MKKRILSLLLAAAMTASIAVGTMSSVSATGSDPTTFKDQVESQYTDPDRVYSSEVRWWIGDASNTDEAILEEIQALYDAGFRGVELCMQDDKNAPNEIYAYGSDMWAHKWSLMMNKILDLGMTLSLTSGTNWATSNIPGLDPDSEQASQVVEMSEQKLAAGESITSLAKPSTMRETNKGKFVGAYAYKVTGNTERVLPSRNGTTTEYGYEVDYSTAIDLSTQTTFTQGDTVYDQAVSWTAPDNGEYVVFSYWSHGSYQTAAPAVETCYATNYFSKKGVEALKSFWEKHYLSDPELNQKIKEGDVQLFMDSIELKPQGGITWWSEEIVQEFKDRKGYDIMPYLFLIKGLPQVAAVYDPYSQPAQGTHDLQGDIETREKVINDWVDVLTQLYCENMLAPLKTWLNSVGIKTRAQISYGRSFEITEPAVYVDYPEAESFNQYNQVDILRLWSAGSHLLDKVLSSETGTELSTYYATQQLRLSDAYHMYASGFQRVIWHIWSAGYSYGTDAAWPGWGSGFDRWGTREPAYNNYDEFNAHIGRVQQLLQTGTSRTDVGFIHNNWNQGIRFGGGMGNDLGGMDYMKAHMGVYYRSTELQDNGYTYDYFSPDLLKADGVYFDEETKTIEPAGYKSLVLYQDWLDVDGAKLIYQWAQKGLPVFIMQGAAVRTPFNDAQDAELDSVMAAMRALSNVKDVEIYDAPDDFNYFDKVAAGYDDGLYDAMQEMGIRPYTEFSEANHQLLTQTRQDADGNQYLYAYNYCSNDYHQNSHIEGIKDEDHGTNIQTEIKMDGMFVPYQINAWTGEVTEVGNYYYDNGQTVIQVDIDYDDIALYAFEAVDQEKFHAVSTTADHSYVTDDNKVVVRATQTGTYDTELSDSKTVSDTLVVPESYPITNWDLTVESWTAGTDKLYSTETIDGVETVNTKVTTDKTKINVKLDQMTTWDNIPEIGKDVSGVGTYDAAFDWDSNAADGAYIDFGSDFYSSMKVWINGQKVGGAVSENASKKPQSVIPGRDGAEQYTGGISCLDPIVDVSKYLVDGKNTIHIEYSSTLGNVQLSRGAISSTAKQSWWGEDRKVKYLSYGPSQAVVIPFVEAEYTQAETNKTILNKVIEYAEAAYESDEFDNVIEMVQESFTAALENARAVAADLGADQAAIDSAWQTLMKEIHKLGFVRGDKTSLGALLEMATECSDKIDRYTEATAAVFVPTYETALAVYNDGNAMQDEVTEAESALLDALVQLRYRADKSVLEAVLAEASKVDTAAYTAESVAAFNAANEQANKVNSDPNAAQDEVDAAAKALRAAIDGLKTVESADNAATINGDKAMTTGSGNAKTGETTPVAAAVAVFALAGACFAVSRKRK